MAFDQYLMSFYGPWRLRTGAVDESHNAQNAFIISGSDDQDGTYYPRATDPPLTMTVSGSAWRLSFARRNYGLLVWVEVAAQRLTTFDPAEGVGVELDTRRPFSTGSGTQPGMQMFGTLRDPSTQVPDPGPFDFTVPELPERQQV
jgi:hypothetical protein